MKALIVVIVTIFIYQIGLACAAGGRWQLLQQSIGISAMHMQQLNNDRVVVFDRTDFGRSNLPLPAGKCRNDPAELAVKNDCTAHSAEYNVAANTFRPLTVQTDVWCSSGALMPDGTLTQTGGFNDGERRVRHFTPCDGNAACDWEEVNLGLSARRWYATNHILPGGRQIIIGGRREFNYEFFPKRSNENGVVSLPFLQQTNDRGIENNLYPFVFLCPDGNLFIFANNRAILLDYTNNKVVRTFPTIPGGDPRSYPSTGSAVLLPLKNIQSQTVEAEVLVCGGAPKGSYVQTIRKIYVEALKTCARIKVTDPKPEWAVETMPMARVMGDMAILPNGDVVIINGAGSGTAGWEAARDPVLSPVVYKPGNKVGSRFAVQNPTTIPRLYHSTAVLLRDGRVLVGGSNPHIGYNFTRVEFPTELSLEAFSPDYLDNRFANVRPKIFLPLSQAKLTYGQNVAVRFRVGGGVTSGSGLVKVTLVSPSFATHSFSMNQRLLELPLRGGVRVNIPGTANDLVLPISDQVRDLGKKTFQVEVNMPATANLAPSGYYMLFVVHQDVPSEGVWVHLS